MMDAKRDYSVETTKDDAGSLLYKLHYIAKEGGRVVNVMWLPKREVADGFEAPASFVIVVEHEN